MASLRQLVRQSVLPKPPSLASIQGPHFFRPQWRISRLESLFQLLLLEWDNLRRNGGKLSSLQLLDLTNNVRPGRDAASRHWGHGELGAAAALWQQDRGFDSGLLRPAIKALRCRSGLQSAIRPHTRRICAGSLLSLFLYLENNLITGLPANLRKLTSLQWVDLSNNPISSSDAIAGLATAPLLSQIELAEGIISKLGVAPPSARLHAPLRRGHAIANPLQQRHLRPHSCFP
ncbi:hypothetical protein L7F22_045930 [Adiantum nelumboides]|nr:hypothetical protein [Adiantum nelumboides]